LPEDHIRLDRPFACASCQKVAETVPRTFGLGCFGIAAAITLLATTLGLQWGWAMLAGLVVGFAAMLALTNWLRKRLPLLGMLRKHELRFHPDTAGPLASWIDSLAGCSDWQEAQETKLKLFQGTHGFDDGLETAAINAAERFRALLGTVSHEQSNTHELEKLRLELQMIARDIRTSMDSD